MEIRNRQSFFYARLTDQESTSESDSNQSSWQNLKLYICTWNVNTKSPTFDIKELIQFDLSDMPSICAFGFQEINSKPWQRILDFFLNDPWTNKLDEILGKMNYARVQSTRLVGILLNIYVKKTLLPNVICCSQDWIRLGLYGFWGNKGANICSIKIGDTNICFVNTHLSAHEHQDKERLIEHSKIMYHSFQFGDSIQSVIDQNYLFFFGDLNFRVENLDIFHVKDLIDREEFKLLQENDQLQKSINKEKCFSLFKEDTINFPPTYKFILNTDDYDLSKKNRVPSYCDRVLFKIPTDDFFCRPLKYNHIPCLKQSDHRPVYASFEIRTILLQINDPAVFFFNICANNDQNLEINYQVKNSFNTHLRDWIAIYDENFKSIDDYITYKWAPRVEELENSFVQCFEKKTNRIFCRRIVFDQSYITSGNFIIGYFSYNYKSLIGMSSIVQINLT